MPLVLAALAAVYLALAGRGRWLLRRLAASPPETEAEATWSGRLMLPEVCLALDRRRA